MSGENRVFREVGYGEAGQFIATYALRLPWAHPIWPEYALSLVDLKLNPGLPCPIKHLPNATHEMLLFAVSPDTPIDFERKITTQTFTILEPANLGYQFEALNDDAALLRIDEMVRLMRTAQLSPDTDHRAAWDELFRDGFSLVKSGFSALLEASTTTKH